MPDFTVTLAKSSRKELEKLPPQFASRVVARIAALAGNPRPNGCEKLKGNNALRRMRVGSYRVLHAIDDLRRVVDISAIGDRKELYRD